MSATRQGMSSAEIKQIVAQHVANSIEAIAVYEIKIRIVHNSMDQIVRQGAKVARNTNNKRKWEGGYQNNTGQQNKRQKVVRAHTTGPGNKKGYAGTLPNCNMFNLHHTGSCTVKCNNSKRVDHMTKTFRTPVPATTQRPSVANKKPIVTCFGCGAEGHFKSKCPRLKNHNHGYQKGKKGKAHENSNLVNDNADA
ncbi:reverse transcriptase domain-containing protein [Tanacetum coccineum]